MKLIQKEMSIEDKKIILWEEIKEKYAEHFEDVNKQIENGIITNEAEDMEYQKKFNDQLNEYIFKRKKELGIE